MLETNNRSVRVSEPGSPSLTVPVALARRRRPWLRGSLGRTRRTPRKPGPPKGLREGLARALETGGPECPSRPQGPLPAEQVGRAVEAPPGRTTAVGARRASAAARSEEPEAATDVGRRRDAPRPVLRASEGGGGEQWTNCQRSANRRGSPRGERARGRGSFCYGICVISVLVILHIYQNHLLREQHMF